MAKLIAKDNKTFIKFENDRDFELDKYPFEVVKIKGEVGEDYWEEDIVIIFKDIPANKYFRIEAINRNNEDLEFENETEDGIEVFQVKPVEKTIIEYVQC